MRIDSWPDWHTQKRVLTEPTPSGDGWCGIAIGPDSDEARILVDGFPLQAGRTLPLRANKYSIQRVRPRASELVNAEALSCINTLSLVLFAHPGELGAHVARPNGQYSVRDWVTPNVAVPALTFPFVGRKQALVVLQSPDLGVGTFTYDVIGVRYQYSSRSIVRFVLKTAAGVNLSTNGTYAFYIGCDEQWDAIEITVRQNAATWNIDAEPSGETGL